jgi:hypothetical protein
LIAVKAYTQSQDAHCLWAWGFKHDLWTTPEIQGSAEEMIHTKRRRIAGKTEFSASGWNRTFNPSRFSHFFSMNKLKASYRRPQR